MARGRSLSLRVLVIGGGASGLTAAISAARAGAAVAVADRMDRVGKKLLASGNGRCNLSNISINRDNYHGAGVTPAFSTLEKFGSRFVVDFFRSIGVLIALEAQARYYPITFHSSTVLDALRAEAARLGVVELCAREAISINPENGIFKTIFHDGQEYISDRVIVAAGGMAPQFLGANGSGYGLLTKFGHKAVAPAPMLTQLRLGAKGIRGLKGVRVRAGLSLYKSGGINAGSALPAEAAAARVGQLVYHEAGELIFSEYGISGIPALNLSCRLAPDISAALGTGQPGGGSGGCGSRVGGNKHISDNNGEYYRCAGHIIEIDLFPDHTYDVLYKFLCERIESIPHMYIDEALNGILHKRIAALIIRQALGELPVYKQNPKTFESDTIRQVSRDQIRRITVAMKAWRHELVGVAGFDKAQVTYGGLSFDDFSIDSLESKFVKGLYAAGEILDVAGECGGYNLHWAWVSGYLAGMCAAGGLT